MQWKVFCTIAVTLAALVVIAASGAVPLAALSTTTPTIPVKTQVWLDITATAAAQPTITPSATATASPTATRTPSATATASPAATRTPSPTPNYTATYDAEFEAALQTVTARAPRPTNTPSNAPEVYPSEVELVEGGSFVMGTTLEEATTALNECADYGRNCFNIGWVNDAIPAHRVTVDDFYLERTEVTLRQFVAFLNWRGPNSHLAGCGGWRCAFVTSENEFSLITFDGETYGLVNPDFYWNHPAAMVTWFGADAYCRAFDRRLPTEAEWERAARGPDNLIYPWGNTFETQYTNTAISGTGGTVQVGFGVGASDFGIYELAGNVNEWTADWYDPQWYRAEMLRTPTNPTGPAAGTDKVLRGGGWDTIPLFARSVHRMSAPPSLASAGIGFRCAEGGGVPFEPLPTPIPTVTPSATLPPG
jgi:formylglycine-generating enzyme required for sulfatase activity